MNINSLLLLSAMVFFSSLFGVLGIILAIPICGVIKVIYGYLKETLFVDEESDLNKDLSDRIAEFGSSLVKGILGTRLVKKFRQNRLKKAIEFKFNSF